MLKTFKIGMSFENPLSIVRIAACIFLLCPSLSFGNFDLTEKCVPKPCPAGKKYHCLVDENWRQGETCLDNLMVTAGMCPYYNTYRGNLDVRPCEVEVDIDACPKTNYQSYNGDKYSGCMMDYKMNPPASTSRHTTMPGLTTESMATDLRSPTTEIHTTSQGAGVADSAKGMYQFHKHSGTRPVKPWVVAIIVSICSVVLVATLVVICYKKNPRFRRFLKRNKHHRNEDSEMVDDPKETTSMIKDNSKNENKEQLTTSVSLVAEDNKPKTGEKSLNEDDIFYDAKDDVSSQKEQRDGSETFFNATTTSDARCDKNKTNTNRSEGQDRKKTYDKTPDEKHFESDSDDIQKTEKYVLCEGLNASEESKSNMSSKHIEAESHRECTDTAHTDECLLTEDAKKTENNNSERNPSENSFDTQSKETDSLLPSKDGSDSSSHIKSPESDIIEDKNGNYGNNLQSDDGEIKTSTNISQDEDIAKSVSSTLNNSSEFTEHVQKSSNCNVHNQCDDVVVQTEEVDNITPLSDKEGTETESTINKPSDEWSKLLEDNDAKKKQSTEVDQSDDVPSNTSSMDGIKDYIDCQEEGVNESKKHENTSDEKTAASNDDKDTLRQTTNNSKALNIIADHLGHEAKSMPLQKEEVLPTDCNETVPSESKHENLDSATTTCTGVDCESHNESSKHEDIESTMAKQSAIVNGSLVNDKSENTQFLN